MSIGRRRGHPAAFRQRCSRGRHHIAGVGRTQELGVDRGRRQRTLRHCRGSPRTPITSGSATVGDANEILQRDPSLAARRRPARSAIPEATSRAIPTPSGPCSPRSTPISRMADRPHDPTYPTFADGHDALLVTEAVARSSQEQRWIRVDEMRRTLMKLGLLTAPFPETPLEEVADWTAASGFTTIEIACWPASSGDTRRYAGTSHIDVDGISDAQASEIVDSMTRERPRDLRSRLLPQSAAPRRRARPYGHRPPEEGDRRRRQDGSRRWSTRSSVRIRSLTQDENWEKATKVWPEIIACAEENGVKMAIENCPMIFSRDEWPSGHNLAYNPKIWRRMFEEFGETIGLNFDPSHLVWLMIDIEQRDPRIRRALLSLPGQRRDDRRRGPLREREHVVGNRMAGTHGSPASVTWIGPWCSGRSIASGTTARSSSSTRTATSKRPMIS